MNMACMPMLRLVRKISERTGGENLDTVTKELGSERLDAGGRELGMQEREGNEKERSARQ
jgi:hypothetical protein